MKRALPLRKLVSAIGLTVAFGVAIVTPSVYFIHDYFNVSDQLTYKARLNAARVAQYIDTHGGVWPRQQMRLAELFKLPDIGGWRERRKIYDQGNRLVLDEGGPLVSPAVGRSAPIVVAGSTIGVFVVEESLQNTLYNTWLVALACSLIGYGAYFGLRIFPLRVLDRTLGELHDTQRSLAVQMERLDVALNNMSQGLVMFDSSARLVVVSRRYLEMFGLSPDMVKPGCTIQEVLDQRVLAGGFSAGGAGPIGVEGGAAPKAPHIRLKAPVSVSKTMTRRLP